jgi:hypothetical protein
MNPSGARAFLTGFALLVLLQLIQQFFHPFKLAGLQGAFDGGTKPIFTPGGWFSGKFQQQSDQYLKYNTAFNGDLVRLRNQFDYSAFGNINTILTLGKENYIYDPNYIIALEGKDLITDSLKQYKSLAVEKSIVFLNSAGIPLLVCFAPNKANYYRQFLPGVLIASATTNRNFYKNLLQKHKVPVIDFDNWFLELKDTASYPLVPKFGAHWSTYGAYLAADSLINFISSKSEGQLPWFSPISIERSSMPRYTDDDYLASLNLMKKWPSPEMAYPRLQFHKGDKPAVLIISDSFIWNFYDLEVIQNCFSDKSQTRYYNKTTFDSQKKIIGPADPVSESYLRQFNYILIITSDPSLKDFGFGFFESVAQLPIHE